MFIYFTDYVGVIIVEHIIIDLKCTDMTIINNQNNNNNKLLVVTTIFKQSEIVSLKHFTYNISSILLCPNS